MKNMQNNRFRKIDNLFSRLKKREAERNPQIMNSFVMREAEAVQKNNDKEVVCWETSYLICNGGGTCHLL